MKKHNIIGRTEFIDIPIFDIKKLESKIDTGAYSSSIDCSDIKEEHNKLSFRILDENHEQYKKDCLYVFDTYKKVEVKSSNGNKEDRFCIELTILIDGVSVKSDFTLSKRTGMEYPILIGRKSIPEGTLVDVHYKPYKTYTPHSS